MNDAYTNDILRRAAALQAGEDSLRVLPARACVPWRLVAAAAAGLAALYPSVSAALALI